MLFFFFNDTATTEIYTLSLHDALPIYSAFHTPHSASLTIGRLHYDGGGDWYAGDRKSTRLNSSHGYISYAVFCLKKKKKNREHDKQDEREVSIEATEPAAWLPWPSSRR